MKKAKRLQAHYATSAQFARVIAMISIFHFSFFIHPFFP